MSGGRLLIDRSEISHFVEALFPYAEPGRFLSLRAFDQLRNDVPPLLVRPLKLNGNINQMIDDIADAAQQAADYSRPAVFTPPICSNGNPDRARAIDVS